ncbi:MAG: hypothetical protein ABR925_07360 [Acidimicrobiales bacterium]
MVVPIGRRRGFDALATCGSRLRRGGNDPFAWVGTGRVGEAHASALNEMATVAR